MEREINFKFEDIYSNMDEKNNKLTKDLLHEKSCNTNTSDPFFSIYHVLLLFII
jgi:hypothetical protein